MSYLLESLGRGLLGRLGDAFNPQFPKETKRLPQLLRMQEQMPTSLDVALRVGAAQLRELHLADAQRAFERALTIDQSAVKAHLGLACVYDERGRLEESLRHLELAARLDARDPAIAFGRGFCCERMGDETGASEHYAAAARLCSTLRNARERLGALAIRALRWDEAAEHYGVLCSLEPDSVDALLTAATIDLHRGRARDAVERYQSALLVEPETTEEVFSRGEDLMSREGLEAAIGEYERLSRQFPGMPEFQLHLADLYARIGDDTGATRHYAAALELRPDLLEANIKLGTQHLRRRRYYDASMHFNRAVELNDRLLTAFVGLGVAQREAGRAADAQGTFDLAVSLAPSTTLLFAETVRLHRRACSGGGGAAVAVLPDAQEEDELSPLLHCYEQAARRFEACAEIPYRYGLLLRQAGEVQRAAEAFRTAVWLNPAFCKAQIKLGVTLRELGREDAARRAFEGAVRLDEAAIEVHYQIGLLFAQRGRFEMLLERYELEESPDRRDLPMRCNVLLALQNIGMIDRAAASMDLVAEVTRGGAGFRDAMPEGRRRFGSLGG